MRGISNPQVQIVELQTHSPRFVHSPFLGGTSCAGSSASRRGAGEADAFPAPTWLSGRVGKKCGVEAASGYAARHASNSLGQLLMTGVSGFALDAATAATFRRIQPGAFILFGRNIRTVAQLRKLIDDLRELSAVEPVITID